MENIKTEKQKSKKKLIIIILASVLLLLLVVGSVYYYYHPTHYKYNDKFILGNTYENVVEKYGEFDCLIEFENANAHGYLVKEQRPGFFEKQLAEYYWVAFNLDGIATHVYVDISPGDDW